MSDVGIPTPSDSSGQREMEQVKSLSDIYQVMDNLSPSVFAGLATIDGKVIYANRSALDAVGATIEDIKGQSVESTPWMAHSENTRREWRKALAAAAGGIPSRFEFTYQAAGTGPRTMDLTVRPAMEGGDQVRYIVTTAQDITERRRIEQLLGITHFAIERAKIALLQLSPDGRVYYANVAACKLLGYASDKLHGLAIEKISKHVQSIGWPTVWRRLQERSSLHYEAVYFRADGNEVPVEVTAIYGRFGADEYAFGFVADLSERKTAERHIHFLAHFDVLTGLPNRHTFLETTERNMAIAMHARTSIAVVIADIERFRLINDTLGRARADQLLQEIAERFRHYAKGQDRLARLGADQFALIITDMRDEQEVEDRVERKLKEVFGTPFLIGGNEIYAAAKIGVAIFPRDGSDAETMFQKAEIALNSAKKSIEKYRLYNLGMGEVPTDRLKLENKLRHALERGQFLLHYQPKVNLASGHIEGVEALLRWNDPEAGLVAPMRFIPLLEETGLIVEVGAWVFRQALHDYHDWCSRGLDAPRIAVNVSIVQIHRPDFVSCLRREIESHKAPHGIDLEITETILMGDVQANVEKLSAVRAMGCGIGIDDFGTGYSSLAYLTKLPVQTLKIDRSFVSTMLDEPNTKTLVSVIISMAHALKLQVVAEGVETELQADTLRLFGCDQMQGYLFSKPIPADDLVAKFLGSRPIAT
ncbi:MAG: sensory box/GGDEF family protein [Herminiimonas sp.]|nr:sensory box/GGDEF family protein [Herminiimonas sp.]